MWRNFLANELDDHRGDSAGLEIEESDRACLDTVGVLRRFAEFRELSLQSRD
jgi:hypothetical protein